MTGMARILVVDDELSMQEFLEIFFRSEGYDVVTAGDVASGRLHLESGDFDVLITDVQMPDGSGLDLLEAAHEHSPDTMVIMITAFASTESAITAMKQGAYDYITKPFNVDEIRIVVEKALEKKLLSSENKRLRTELRSQERDRSIIGNSQPMQRIFELVHQVADTKATVLVTGESGTGKEMVARALHQGGERSEKPIVVVNCAAIPENLLESELFGHVKGAFTGAIQNKAGLFEVADRGTLFLDEVGELPASLQVKLLRVIQERTFRRVGGTRDQKVDVRIVAATNRRLEEEVRAGRFREDLYYRLNVIEIRLPTLRGAWTTFLASSITSWTSARGSSARKCTAAATRPWRSSWPTRSRGTCASSRTSSRGRSPSREPTRSRSRGCRPRSSIRGLPEIRPGSPPPG